MKLSLKTILPLAATMILSSCGSGSSGSGSKSQDIPDYAVGKGSYLTPRAENKSHALCGLADGRTAILQHGMYKNGQQLKGDVILMDNKEIEMLCADSYSLSNYFIEEEIKHTMHLLWHEADPENPHNEAMGLAASVRGGNSNAVEGNYSDTYYFCPIADFDAAKQYIETLEKQPNQSSQYDIKAYKEQGGTKTYKAKVGKSVRYFGYDKLKSDEFLSLYLDCGAVVQLHYKDSYAAPRLEGETIDCVTDDNNRVLEHTVES